MTGSGRRARRWRLVLLAGLALPIMLGSWLRTPDPLNYDGELSIARLPDPGDDGLPVSMDVRALWQLDAPRTDFGGYSGLLALPGGQFLAFADKGDALRFSLPGAGRGTGHFFNVPKDPRYRREFQDIESATRDPATGHIWLGYEAMNAIRRLEPDGSPAGMVRPLAMRHWTPNTGPEALVRLADGRFLVMNEGTGEGLLWAQDPRSGQEPARFRYIAPHAMSVTDAAQLPDGRVLVLLRKLTLGWLPFGAGLAIADPAQIREGGNWPLEWLTGLTGPLPADNYEALDVTQGADGALHLWIMSDDNLAILQRTLLAQIRWEGWQDDTKKGATGEPGAPSKSR